MFSIFKQASGTRDVVLKDLSEDQLSEVAGGKAHHHHHHHKHHKHHHHTWNTHPTTTTTTPPMTTNPTQSGTVTSGGVTYPARTHW